MMHDKIVRQSNLKPRDLPVIEAETFVLRPLRLSDMGLIEHYTKDERVARNTRKVPHPLPPTATEAFIRRALTTDQEGNVWTIDAAAHGGAEVMGLITLRPADADGEAGIPDTGASEQAEVHFWVGPAFWNSGIATAALNALIAANPGGHRTYFASVFQDNPASARVLTNCGFAYIGDAESYSVARAAKVATWTYSRKLD
ncbi:GNAT family N-acetyltransferase [Pseudooceanicola nanhaiensis]|uniref:GNAT family N-acetyltransferase n=1 Tax=Pseudooceanicola nanhaiensis TaxID=375761 RepID=UPI00398FE104